MRQKIQSLFSDKLVKNIGWLTASQLFIRVIRLASVVVLARVLTAEDYGLIAILFTVTDFANVFIQKGGIAPKLIQANKEEVYSLAETAYWTNWILCFGIFLFQCAMAYPIALFYQNDKLFLPIVIAAIAYLINPFYAVQDALIRRENRLKVGAIASVCSAFTQQLTILVLVVLGFGVWSIAISLVASQFCWLIIYRRNHAWMPAGKFTLYQWRKIFDFSKFPLGIEMLNYLRSNIDYLLIGRFFSVEQLGFYFFAFNAGLGISLTAINMVSNSVFPYLCEARENLVSLKASYRKSLKVCAMIIFPLVILQSTLAPFYVPIVFGQKWIPAIPILIMVCLSALPRPFALVSEQLLLTLDRGMAGLKWNIFFTGFFALSIVAAAQFNIFVVAGVVLAVHLVCLPMFSAYVARSAFSGQKVALVSEL